MRCKTCKAFILVILLCLSQPFAAGAQTPPAAGLLWNRTGLPAVFPLQIKTNPDFDYLVTLRDADTDVAALAAYIKGGKFFQVLVPPGRFALEFAAGAQWQNETILFGPGGATHRFNLAEPLTFAVRGVAIKAGHLVDLTRIDLSSNAPRLAENSIVSPSAICQTIARDTENRILAPHQPNQRSFGRLAEPNALSALPRSSPDPEVSTFDQAFQNPANLPEYLRQRTKGSPASNGPLGQPERFEVRNRPC